MATYRHSMRFFRRLLDEGRPDLAALNAAVDGRLMLAFRFYRKWGLSARDAWKLTWGTYREHRR